MTDQKNIIITGTSSGMGEAAARYLAERGYRVFGGNLDSKEGAAGPSISSHTLDIRSDESVERFMEEMPPRIDALINNAGFALAGAVEETSLEEARDQVETNLFGAVRMCKKVLPVMRKQGHGRIINTSSGAAVAAGPFHAFYSASKFGVEGFTEALRHEVRPLGIHVSILQPGCFQTKVVEHARQSGTVMEEYNGPRDRCLEALKKYSTDAPAPIHVARLFHKILKKKRPGLRYRIGKDVTLSHFFRRFLPESWYQAMIADYYRIPGPRRS